MIILNMLVTMNMGSVVIPQYCRTYIVSFFALGFKEKSEIKSLNTSYFCEIIKNKDVSVTLLKRIRDIIICPLCPYGYFDLTLFFKSNIKMLKLIADLHKISYHSTETENRKT